MLLGAKPLGAMPLGAMPLVAIVARPRAVTGAEAVELIFLMMLAITAILVALAPAVACGEDPPADVTLAEMGGGAAGALMMIGLLLLTLRHRMSRRSGLRFADKDMRIVGIGKAR
jgi:hypothetical protein